MWKMKIHRRLKAVVLKVVEVERGSAGLLACNQPAIGLARAPLQGYVGSSKGVNPSLLQWGQNRSNRSNELPCIHNEMSMSLFASTPFHRLVTTSFHLDMHQRLWSAGLPCLQSPLLPRRGLFYIGSKTTACNTQFNSTRRISWLGSKYGKGYQSISTLTIRQTAR